MIFLHPINNLFENLIFFIIIIDFGIYLIEKLIYLFYKKL